MPTLNEQLAAVSFTITPPVTTIDLTKPVEFHGRRENGVVYMRISAQTTTGQPISTREFTMPEAAAFVTSTGGAEAGANFASAAGVVFPNLKVFGMYLVGAEAVVP